MHIFTLKHLDTGLMCECGSTMFHIRSGGSSCCSWKEYECATCGKTEHEDTGSGDC